MLTAHRKQFAFAPVASVPEKSQEHKLKADGFHTCVMPVFSFLKNCYEKNIYFMLHIT